MMFTRLIYNHSSDHTLLAITYQSHSLIPPHNGEKNLALEGTNNIDADIALFHVTYLLNFLCEP